MHSEETARHSKRIASLAVRFGRALGIRGAELEALRYGSLLHDIGKLDVPLEYLHKPGFLEAHESAVVNQHPATGAAVARLRKLPEAVCDAILFHHERFDGAGYPTGIAGESIPRVARIIAVVDTFDTIVNKRCYREARAVAVAREELVRCAGTQFDPKLAGAFVSLIDVLAKRQDGEVVAA